MVKSRKLHLIERVLGVLAYVYGYELVEKLLSHLDEMSVEFNPVLNRVKQLNIGDKLVFTLRASDGYYLPVNEGVEYLKNVAYIRITDDAAEHVRKGKSVMCKTVLEVKNVEPGLDVPILDESGQVVAVGRVLVSEEECLELTRNVRDSSSDVFWLITITRLSNRTLLPVSLACPSALTNCAKLVTNHN
jgi:uncharacterized protein with predicted RNA binding PUA domain